MVWFFDIAGEAGGVSGLGSRISDLGAGSLLSAEFEVSPVESGTARFGDCGKPVWKPALPPSLKLRRGKPAFSLGYGAARFFNRAKSHQIRPAYVKTSARQAKSD